MPRRYIDCREFPSDMNCSVAISADSDGELLDRDGTPPADAPRSA